MSNNIFVIKRSGALEKFNQGRIALAIFKAFKAAVEADPISNNAPSNRLSEGRSIGANIAKEINVWLIEKKISKITIEELQDQIVEKLKSYDESVSKGYQDYRLLRDSIRRQKENLSKKIKLKNNFVSELLTDNEIKIYLEKLRLGFKAHISTQDIFTLFEHKGWSNITTSSQLRTLISQGIIQSGSRDLSSFDLISYFKYLNILEERIPILFCEETESIEEKVKSFYMSAFSDLQLQGDQLQQVIELYDLQLDARAALILLEKISELNIVDKGQKELPFEVFVRFVFALKGLGFEEHLLLLNLIKNKILMFPLDVLIKSKEKLFSLADDAAIIIEDNLESIFEVLKKIAVYSKEHISVNVDLSRLRSKNSSVSVFGKTSGGVEPVLNLILQTADLIKGKRGVGQKVRISIGIWHQECELLLQKARFKEKNLQLAIYIPDVFMKILQKKGMWPMINPMFLEKNMNFDEDWVEQTIKAIEGGLIDGKIVNSIELFDALTQTIFECNSPSIVFTDPLLLLSGGKFVATSARMTNIMTSEGSVAHIGLNINPLSKMPRAEARELREKIENLLIKINKFNIIEDYPILNILVFGRTEDDILNLFDVKEEDYFINLSKLRGGLVNYSVVEENRKHIKVNSNIKYSFMGREEFSWFFLEPAYFLKNTSFEMAYQIGEVQGVRRELVFSNKTESTIDFQAQISEPLVLDLAIDKINKNMLKEKIINTWFAGGTVIRRYIIRNK